MSSSKRKHNSLSLEKKLLIIDRIEKGESMTKLAIEFNVGKSTVFDIKTAKEKIREFASKLFKGHGTTKVKTMRQANDGKLEQCVYTWFLHQRGRGFPVCSSLLAEKAKYYDEKLNGDNSGFKASDGWITRFKKRHGIRGVGIHGERLSNNAAAIEPFITTFHKIIQDEGLINEQLYNADETGIYWKVLPDKTLASRDESHAAGHKISKERLTILACSNATGSHKLPLTVIGKSKNPRVFKNITQLPVNYKSQKSAWMNADIFREWFFDQFVPKVTAHLKNLTLPVKAILLLDNAPSHPNEDELKTPDGAIRVFYMPPNTTALIQPMDQHVLQSIKTHYRKKLLFSLVSNEDDDATIPFLLKKITIKDAVFWMAEAWEEVTSGLILSSWKRIAPQLNILNEAFDEREPPLMDYDPTIEAEIQTLLEKIPSASEIEENDVREWLSVDNSDGGYEILNDEDILAEVDVQDGDKEKDNDSDEEAAPSISNKHAVAIFNEALTWLEQQQDSDLTEILLIRRLRDRAAMQHFKSVQQKTILTYFTQQQ